MQAQRVIGVINTERRLNDRQINVEFNTRGRAELEIRTRSNLQLGLLILQGELRIDVIHTGLIQAQSALTNNSNGSRIQEQGHAHGAVNGNAIFEIADSLQIVPRKCNGIGEKWNREATGRGNAPVKNGDFENTKAKKQVQKTAIEILTGTVNPC